MKGIVLAGGNGSRLRPSTSAASKQLFPIYDKPMIYYPIAVLMLAGIREILVISAPESISPLQRVFGDGKRLGLDIGYREQKEPRGIAEALLIGERHIDGRPSALVLGDNLFHGPGFEEAVQEAARTVDGCVLFGHKVFDPCRYGVGGFDRSGRLISIEEKPERPDSDYAVTGLYFYGADAVEVAKEVRPSARGELEITDVNRAYLAQERARFVTLEDSVAWFDAGTEESLFESACYVHSVLKGQGERIACLEEIALRMGFIDAEACHRLGEEMKDSPYGRYVMEKARRSNGTR
ncbi:glucose-1-phosphate thymidylyltransferase RfbA [Nocardiopsis ansamitocini]|uniref:Glucose-1-phosphate thymidylyltransferase n=1 Tax=Nocardiopsis ansamitocini TaxID=1670832 RepID=A0A9W6PAL1_9ACTN|nr:glucose-1-phosphate thymidylyltransferase RfbA [Nocardiopsis ansamitocini]GLU50038.1 glucose-1-phosphate thymidylyltransferase [Nocardiopsis ansamitocini]